MFNEICVNHSKILLKLYSKLISTFYLKFITKYFETKKLIKISESLLVVLIRKKMLQPKKKVIKKLQHKLVIFHKMRSLDPYLMVSISQHQNFNTQTVGLID